MKYRYSFEKNALLLATRKIGFEEIIHGIERGNLLEIVAHPNQELYPSQKIMFVRLLDEVYVVPFVMEKDGTIFLKTLYPSRKARKIYLEKYQKRSS